MRYCKESIDFALDLALGDPKRVIKELSEHEECISRMIQCIMPDKWEFVASYSRKGRYMARRFSDPSVIDDNDPVEEAQTLRELFQKMMAVESVINS